MTATLRPIAQIGNDILRQTALALPTIPLQVHHALMADMLKTLDESGGVGLAAPQVHESVRIIIVASKPTARYPNAPAMPATIMLNPEYTVLSETMEKGWEGCLSIPGIRALVPRYQHIGVAYTDHFGQAQEAELEGFVARIFQHEIDHLDGLLYLDRVECNRDIISEAEYFKLR